MVRRIKTPRIPPRGLNPRLYGLLAARFGRVEIGCEGEPAVVATPAYDRRSGLMRTQFAALGEYYKISCPYCDDRGMRLWVNHRWCTADPESGEPLEHLAICYHQDCLKRHYQAFRDLVLGDHNASTLRAWGAATVLEPASAAPPTAGPMTLPGDCVPLSDLPRDHRACRYLEGRGFDPAGLSGDHGVAYCERSPALPAARGRIIAPVTSGGDLVGWQGRWAGELDWKKEGIPKYLNAHGSWKSSILYNGDRASAESPRLVVAVEGVADVWAGGPAFVSPLGKTFSRAQLDLLAAWGTRGGLCVLCLDPGAWTTEVSPKNRARAAEKRAALLDRLHRDFSGRVVEATLPKGTDPAMLGRDALWRHLAAEAKVAGRRLSKYRDT